MGTHTYPPTLYCTHTHSYSIDTSRKVFFKAGDVFTVFTCTHTHLPTYPILHTHTLLLYPHATQGVLQGGGRLHCLHMHTHHAHTHTPCTSTHAPCIHTHHVHTHTHT